MSARADRGMSPALAASLAPAGDAMAVSLHESPLPSFVEAELARLYQSVFSSLAQWRILGQSHDASAYVVREGGEVTTLLLFRRESGAVHVLNEVISLGDDDVRRFAATIFAAYQSVNVITFHAVEARIGSLPFPYQRFNCLEDIVLDLPDSKDAYFSALGKNMRASLKRYQKKIAADFPGFRYALAENEAIDEQQVAAIVALSSARMASKKQVSGHTDIKTEQLIRLVKSHGAVSVATIDGRVCAGVICSRVGANFFMHVVAHDPAYDDYRIGKLCCYLSICDAIDRAGQQYHFLWGRYEYKFRLLGVQRDLDHLVVYRSRLRLLLDGMVFLRTAWRGYGRRAKLWLQDEKRREQALPKLMLAAWRLIRARPA